MSITLEDFSGDVAKNLWALALGSAKLFPSNIKSRFWAHIPNIFSKISLRNKSRCLENKTI